MKIGDIVRLNSGGPLMTVSEIYTDDTVKCTWFLNDELKNATFQKEAITVENDMY